MAFCQLTNYRYMYSQSSTRPVCRQFLHLFREVDVQGKKLFIRNANTQWQGIFRCNASNEFNVRSGQGPSSSQFRLVVIDRPGAVRDFQADESLTTSSVVVLKFRRPERDGNKPILHYLLEYNDLFDTPKQQHVSNTTFVVKIGNLHPGHVYKFTLYGINAVGRSESQICHVSTLQTSKLNSSHSVVEI